MFKSQAAVLTPAKAGPKTEFVVQGFRRSGKQTIKEQPRIVKSEEDAIRVARQLAATGVAVAAFEIGYDPEVNLETEPRVFFTSGQVPGLEAA